MLLNPNGILLFSIQFGFNNPMGESEHQIAKKYVKIANIVNLEGKMLKFSNKSVFKSEQWAYINYNLFNF